MDMSQATQQLLSEHRAIETVLVLLGRAADRIEAGRPVDPAVLDHAVDFIRHFADECHHAKEEGALFPAMVQHGVPKTTGPIGVMLADHDLGRSYVQVMVRVLPGYGAGDQASATALVESLRDYTELLKGHIQKEDLVLYPLSDRVLPVEEQAVLFEEFERIEREVAGPGEHENHLALIGELERLVS
jgi:hemerythrin-like domain-containing protein